MLALALTLWTTVIPQGSIADFFSPAAQAAIGDRYVMRSQWPDGALGKMSASFFKKNSRGTFDPHTSGKLLPDPNHCDDILGRYQVFPLFEMFERGLITKSELDSFSELFRNLDFRQVVFLHSVIEEKITAPLKSDFINFNMVRLFERGTANANLEDYAYLTQESLKAESSMWLVRGFLPGSNGKLSERILPWQLNMKFRDHFAKSANDLIHWELGRAAQTMNNSIRDLLKAAIFQATSEALLFKIPLNQAKIYVHAKIKKLADHYCDEYGFKVFVQSEDGEAVLLANLDQLSKDFPAESFLSTNERIANISGVKGINNLILSQTGREALHFLDNIETGRAKQPIVVAYDKFWGFVYQQSLAITNYNSLYEIGQKQIPLDMSLTPTTDLDHAAITPSGSNYTVSQLSIDDFNNDPQYLQKLISDVMTYTEELMFFKGLAPPEFVEDFYLTRKMILATSHIEIANAAQALGGVVTFQKEIPRGGTFNFSPETGKILIDCFVTDAYFIAFDPKRVVEIQNRFRSKYPGRTFQTGVSQLKNRMFMAY